MFTRGDWFVIYLRNQVSMNLDEAAINCLYSILLNFYGVGNSQFRVRVIELCSDWCFFISYIQVYLLGFHSSVTTMSATISVTSGILLHCCALRLDKLWHSPRVNYDIFQVGGGGQNKFLRACQQHWLHMALIKLYEYWNFLKLHLKYYFYWNIHSYKFENLNLPDGTR